MKLQSITTIAFATEQDYLSIISAVNQEAMRHRGDEQVFSVSTSERPGKKQANIMILMDGGITEVEDFTEDFISGVMDTLEKRHDITRATQYGTSITPT